MAGIPQECGVGVEIRLVVEGRKRHRFRFVAPGGKEVSTHLFGGGRLESMPLKLRQGVDGRIHTGLGHDPQDVDETFRIRAIMVVKDGCDQWSRLFERLGVRQRPGFLVQGVQIVHDIERVLVASVSSFVGGDADTLGIDVDVFDIHAHFERLAHEVFGNGIVVLVDLDETVGIHFESPD